jgi:hypothetical protein
VYPWTISVVYSPVMVSLMMSRCRPMMRQVFLGIQVRHKLEAERRS